jgi:ATPase subunit of ABC transporter with duplicated ATPase domains
MDQPLPDDFDPYGGQMIAISGGNGNGKQWLMQLLQGLILAGILGLIGVTWNLTKTVTELQVTFSERDRQNERNIIRLESSDTRHDITDARHDTELRGLDNRLTTLERTERANQPNADDRQKRR